MMKSSSIKSPKSYLYAHNLKNSKTALLRYVIFIQSTSISYHKLPKSPVFLQATVAFICFLLTYKIICNFSQRQVLGCCFYEYSYHHGIIKVRKRDGLDTEFSKLCIAQIPMTLTLNLEIEVKESRLAHNKLTKMRKIGSTYFHSLVTVSSVHITVVCD